MKIRYIISHGVADVVNIDECDTSEIIICFEPKYDGIITIGSSVYPLKNGEACIKTASLRDGLYQPRLECKDGIFSLEGFVKRCRDVIVNGAGDSLTRRLVKRCYELERSTGELSKRVTALENAYKGHDIFNYERKKNENLS